MYYLNCVDLCFIFHHFPEPPVELPSAISSRQVRDILRSEVSTSVPVTNPAVTMEIIDKQMTSLHLKEGEAHQHTVVEAVQSQEDLSKSGNWSSMFSTGKYESKPQSVALTVALSLSSASASPQSALRSIMKRKAEVESGSPSTKKNLQFIGVNGGYVCVTPTKG